MYTKNLCEKIDDKLLATHISNNPDFENACYSGDGNLIMEIVKAEMEEHELFTKGSKRLQSDILRMLQGKPRVSSFVGQRILMFVWNSRMSGIGMAVN